MQKTIITAVLMMSLNVLGTDYCTNDDECKKIGGLNGGEYHPGCGKEDKWCRNKYPYYNENESIHGNTEKINFSEKGQNQYKLIEKYSGYHQCKDKVIKKERENCCEKDDLQHARRRVCSIVHVTENGTRTTDSIVHNAGQYNACKSKASEICRYKN